MFWNYVVMKVTEQPLNGTLENVFIVLCYDSYLNVKIYWKKSINLKIKTWGT